MNHIPIQSNMFDCGIFMLKGIHFKSILNAKLFSQEDILYFRVLMAIELLNGKILRSKIVFENLGTACNGKRKRIQIEEEEEFQFNDSQSKNYTKQENYVELKKNVLCKDLEFSLKTNFDKKEKQNPCVSQFLHDYENEKPLSHHLEEISQNISKNLQQIPQDLTQQGSEEKIIIETQSANQNKSFHENNESLCLNNDSLTKLEIDHTRIPNKDRSALSNTIFNNGSGDGNFSLKKILENIDFENSQNQAIKKKEENVIFEGFLINLKEWPEIKEKIDKFKLNVEDYKSFKCNRGFKLECKNCLQKIMIISIEANKKHCNLITNNYALCKICKKSFVCEGLYHLNRHFDKHSEEVF